MIRAGTPANAARALTSRIGWPNEEGELVKSLRSLGPFDLAVGVVEHESSGSRLRMERGKNNRQERRTSQNIGGAPNYLSRMNSMNTQGSSRSKDFWGVGDMRGGGALGGRGLK